MTPTPDVPGYSRDRRRREVARAHAAGFSVREIMETLNTDGFACTDSTVRRDLDRLKDEWRAANMAAIEERQLVYLQQLDQDIEYHRRRVLLIKDVEAAGQYFAKVILPIMKERAKTDGSHAAQRYDLTTYVREWAQRQGVPEERALRMAAEVVESTGF